MKITVEGGGGVKLSSEERYKELLVTNGIQCLLDSDGDQIDFGLLVDGGMYTLGPPRIQQQQQQVSLFCWTLVFSFLVNYQHCD